LPIEIENFDHGTWVRYVGFVPPSEFIEAANRVAGDPKLATFQFVLFDLSAMDTDSTWALTPEVTATVGEHNRSLDIDRSHIRRIGFVASSDKLFGQCKVFAEKYIFSPNAEVRLFRSVTPALAWVKAGADSP
jgi:hypothetical protein